MSGITQTTPSREPLFVDDVRNYLRLDDDVEETLIVALIAAARQWAENYTGRAFITRTVNQFHDSFNYHNTYIPEGFYTGIHKNHPDAFIELAMTPIATFTEVKAIDDAGSETTWDAANYYVDTVRDVPRLVLRDGGSFPSDLRSANGLKLVYDAGYGASPINIPVAIKMAMMQYCTFMYEHRGDFESSPPPQPPIILKNLLMPYKIMRFGATPYTNALKVGIG
jgi:uncharacterized phiE125 gp8 family phage protein